jgi:anti-anti-sigma regulatory factor
MDAEETRPGVLAKLRVEKLSDGPITGVKLAGTIDEQFEGKRLADSLPRGVTVVLDLAEIERISSFGIREWVDFIAALGQKAASLWFVECAPKVVDQFNMVANFGGAGHLVSFYAPYRCDYCDDDRRRLVVVADDKEALKAGKLPERVCETCGNAEYFDEDPLTFFSFLQTHPAVEPPPEVAAFLAKRLNYAVADGVRKLKIEKQIEGRATYLRLTGDLDSAFPTKKLAEGLEGDVIFDLAGVGKIDPAGAAEWRSLMGQIAAPVERIVLVGCPAGFVERLTKVEDLAQKGIVLSFTMPYSCAACRSTTAREIDVSSCYDILKFATAPELRCLDCKGPLQCAASEALLAHLPTLPRPDVPPELKQQLKKFQEQALAQRLGARGGPQPTGPLVLPTAQVAPAGGFSWTTALVTVGIVVLLAGAVLVARTMIGHGPESERLEASQPARPAWVERTFFREPDRLLFVGRSTLVGDKADGFAEAEDGALEEAANQLSLSMRDPLWIDNVRAQFEAFRVKAIGDLEKAGVAGDASELERARRQVREGRRRVADSLRKTSGGLWPAARSDLYWEKLKTRDGVKYAVSILYAVPKQSFERLAEGYGARETAMGATAVGYFPSLGWRYDVAEGAVVLQVANDSPLRFAGIQEGDLVLSGMDRVVHDARSWKRVLEEETAALAKAGGTLVLKVKRGDAPAIDTRLRIAAGGAASADPSSRLKQTRGSRTKKSPTGNIWDDNPEE